MFYFDFGRCVWNPNLTFDSIDNFYVTELQRQRNPIFYCHKIYSRGERVYYMVIDTNDNIVGIKKFNKHTDINNQFRYYISNDDNIFTDSQYDILTSTEHKAVYVTPFNMLTNMPTIATSPFSKDMFMYDTSLYVKAWCQEDNKHYYIVFYNFCNYKGWLRNFIYMGMILPSWVVNAVNENVKQRIKFSVEKCT